MFRDLRWGVYVVLRASTTYAAECCAQYGLRTEITGRYAAMHKPYHLIGLELNVSVLSAALRSFVEVNGMRVMGPPDWSAYIGGRIQRVDPRSGEVTDLYTSCDGRPLRSPNDLVMDGQGGFWFTDTGIRDPISRTADMTGIFYAQVDGSAITEVVFPTDAPNGIGVSPDGATLYWTESYRGRILRRSITGPGELAPASPFDPATVLYSLPGLGAFDSLAVDGDGYVCAATLIDGGITVVSPDGSSLEHVATGDFATTNICFGGDDLRTAFVTLGRSGKLVSTRWPRPGLRLAHQ